MISMRSIRAVLFASLLLVSARAHPQNDLSLVNINSPMEQSFSDKLAVFAINVYSKLSLLKPDQNIVFSPFSIQTCAAMARVGAEGKTADELDAGLGLVSNDIQTMAEVFHKVLSTYEKSNILTMGNKLYLKKGGKLQETFDTILTQKFLSKSEQIDFADNVAAAKAMNKWVEEKTNNLIKDLISPDALDESTSLVLLNAIHFKGLWQHKFQLEDTHTADFYLNEVDSVPVQMMYLKSRFRYAELTDIDATVLEMPYKDSDLSMLIILPNSRTGLKSLENKLKQQSISDITRRMGYTEVKVKFPKFKTEFEVLLNEPFKQLDMTRMFSDNAEFGKILESSEPLKVSAVIHKAFIEVNEEGTEAAAATGIVMVTYSAAIPIAREVKIFHADKPFYYLIQNSKGVQLFAGNIIKF